MAAQAPMTEATYYILLALMKPGHGYGMMQRIKELSGGRIEMGPGTLYGVLTRMNKEGLITLTSEEGRRKNYATVAHLYTWMCWVRLSKRRTIYYARCIRRSLYFTL